MKEKDEKIILSTDPEAAKFTENISGWVSRNGLFFGKDEAAARYHGCTHVACTDCGAPTMKSRKFCPGCKEKRDAARYEKLECAEWDEKGALYSETADIFFWSWSDVSNYLEEENTTTGELRLVICDPVYLSPINADRWADDLPEDGELPDDIVKALEEFNDILRAAGPISWMPGKKRIKL